MTKKTDSSATGEEQASTQMEVETNKLVTTLQSPAVSVTCESSTSSRSESETTGNKSADFCAADCCSPTRDKQYQPDAKDILAKIKRIEVSRPGMSKPAGLSSIPGLHCAPAGKSCSVLDLICLLSARMQTQPLSAVVLLIGEKLPMPFISMKQVRPTQKPC